MILDTCKQTPWDYEAVQIGQTGMSIAVTVTEESVSKYARSIQHNKPESRGADELTNKRFTVAMPTMIFLLAPLRRGGIAAAHGFTALEGLNENARQTPFTKCEVRWFAPVSVNDVITSQGYVKSKEMRRGNKFVTFGIEATNQDGEKVAEYDYTCVFEYTGRKIDPGQRQPSVLAEGMSNEVRPLIASSFDSIQVGDELIAFKITESQQTINDARMDTAEYEMASRNIHTDPDFAAEGMFAGVVNAGITTMAYVNQMLAHSFQTGSLYGGGSLSFKAILPIRPGDTVTFTGKVISKRVEAGKKVVECEIQGHNQFWKIIGVANAILVVSC